jgi:hypothetical protein
LHGPSFHPVGWLREAINCLAFNRCYFAVNRASIIFITSIFPMKYIVIILLHIPLLSVAQDCKLRKTVDPYTKEVKLSTGLIALSGASLSIDADSKEIDFFISVDSKEKCFNDMSSAVIIYDSSKVKANFKNMGSINCDGFFHLIFKNGQNTQSQLQRLTTKKIVSIVLTDTNKGQTVMTFSPEMQQKIISLGTCLVNEAKALIK